MKKDDPARENERLMEAIDLLATEQTTPDIEARTKTLLIELGLADEIKTAQAIDADPIDATLNKE